MAGLSATVRRFLPRRLGTGAISGSVLVLLAASVAVASIPDSSGVIHGCYQGSGQGNQQGNQQGNWQGSGVLRIIDTTVESCAPGETAISWNQIGPQGPQGPAGPTGPSGLPNGRAWSDLTDTTRVAANSWIQIAPLAGSLPITLSSTHNVLLIGEWSTPPTGPNTSTWVGRFVVDGNRIGPFSAGFGSPVMWPDALGEGTHLVALEVTWICTPPPPPPPPFPPPAGLPGPGPLAAIGPGCPPPVTITSRFLSLVDLGPAS